MFPRASYMTMHVTLNCLGLKSYVVEIKSILVQGKNKVFDLATSRIFLRGEKLGCLKVIKFWCPSCIIITSIFGDENSQTRNVNCPIVRLTYN